MNSRSAAAVLACCMILLAGCAAEELPGAPAPDPGCSAAYPARLPLTTLIAGEEQYQDDTIVCGAADRSAATLENKAGVVFGFSSADERARVELLSSNIAGDAFREGVTARSAITGAFAAPGDTSVLTSPGGLEGIVWEVDAELTAAWLVQDAIVTRVSSLTQEAVVDVLAKGTEQRRSILTCAIAGGYTAKAVDDLEAGSVDFLDAVGVASAASPCVTAWRAAEREAGAAWPTLAEGLTPSFYAAEQVTALRGKVGTVSRWISVAVGVLR